MAPLVISLPQNILSPNLSPLLSLSLSRGDARGCEGAGGGGDVRQWTSQEASVAAGQAGRRSRRRGSREALALHAPSEPPLPLPSPPSAATRLPPPFAPICCSPQLPLSCPDYFRSCRRWWLSFAAPTASTPPLSGAVADYPSGPRAAPPSPLHLPAAVLQSLSAALTTSTFADDGNSPSVVPTTCAHSGKNGIGR